MYPTGKVIVGSISNAAINVSASPPTWRDEDGVPYTLKAGDRLIFYEIHENNRATAKDITMFQDTDADGAIDAGEEIIIMSFAAAGSNEAQFIDGLPSQKINAAATNTIKFLASAAGSVDITVKAEVIRA